MEFSDKPTLEQEFNLKLIQDYFSTLTKEQIASHALETASKVMVSHNHIEQLVAHIKTQSELIQFLTHHLEAQNTLISLFSKQVQG